MLNHDREAKSLYSSKEQVVVSHANDAHTTEFNFQAPGRCKFAPMRVHTKIPVCKFLFLYTQLGEH